MQRNLFYKVLMLALVMSQLTAYIPYIALSEVIYANEVNLDGEDAQDDLEEDYLMDLPDEVLDENLDKEEIGDLPDEVKDEESVEVNDIEEEEWLLEENNYVDHSQFNSFSNPDFMGYYFYGSYFNEPAFISLGEFNGLSVDTDHELIRQIENLKDIKSARWIGQLEIKQSDTYRFFTSSNENIVVKIGGNIVINEGEIKEIYLEEGIYDIEVEYSTYDNNGEIFNITLNWESTSIRSLSSIADGLISMPILDPEYRTVELIPDQGLLTRSNISSRNIDSDRDGIFDDWEINGYTVVRGIVTSWDDSLAGQGYTKYVSNPQHARTARDPYTDLEKVSGRADHGMSPQAMNPLVASVPVISVGMQRMILSRLNSVGQETGNSESRETGSSTSSANTIEVGMSVGASFTGPSISATTNFSNTSTHAVNESNSASNTWSQSLNMNEGEAASLNANVRYYNNGTGVVYNLRPTVNFVLDGDSIGTITATQTHQVNFLRPDESYPRRTQTGIALNTMDDFGSRMIPLNYQQVQKLDNGHKLHLETTQFSGEWRKENTAGSNIISGDWNDFIAQIESSTATIILDLQDGEAVERRIATRNPNNPSHPDFYTPELTIGEAVEIAFDAEKGNGGRWYYNHNWVNGGSSKIPIDENAVHLVISSNTQAEIERQMREKNLDNVYDVTLTREMEIHILPSVFLADGDDHLPSTSYMWSFNSLGINNSGMYALYALNEYPWHNYTSGYIHFDSSTLKPNTTYILSMYVNGNRAGAQLEYNIQVGDQEFNSTFTSSSLEEWNERQSFIFTTGNDANDYEYINIIATHRNPLYIDDISIVELKEFNTTTTLLEVQASQNTFVVGGIFHVATHDYLPHFDVLQQHPNVTHDNFNRIGYISFTVPARSISYPVTKAELAIKVRTRGNSNDIRTLTRINFDTPLDESELTYGGIYLGSWNSSINILSSVPVPMPGEYLYIDITTQLNDYLRSSNTNEDININMYILSDTVASSPNSQAELVSFHSRRASNINDRPKLTIIN